MSTDAEWFTIGQLAERTGVTSRTIRFWSDAGLVPPAGRSATGYRLYDAAAVARLDLVQTLRELGLGLDVVRAVLARATTVAQVAAAHVAVLDEQIRILRLRRAVLKTVATRGNTIEETLLMHKLARLSAQERQQLIDDFVDGVFAGTDPGADPGAPGAGLARRMRQLPAELPDDPTPEQVDAWIELAELIADPGFRERTRTMAQAGQQPRPEASQQPSQETRQEASQQPRPGAGQQPRQPDAPDYQSVQDLAGQALAAGITPGSPEGRSILDRLVPAGARPATLRQLETFTDARVERYWQLLGVLNGQPPFPPAVPAFEWLIAALRASLADGPTATGTASG